MKIRVFSDIHLEHYDQGPVCMLERIFEPADVLILAGDVCVAKYLESPNGSMAKLFMEFFERVSAVFPKVFYVPGNHEHYGGVLQKTTPTLRSALSRFENVSVLDVGSEFYNGWHFVGATLWTDFFNSPVEMVNMASVMNDYKGSIRHAPTYRRLLPQDTAKIHSESLYWMERAIPTLRGPVCVITHHAPTTLSSRSEFREYLPAYCNNLGSFILSHPSIKYWVHGHTHSPYDYMVGDECRVVCNPLGYPCHLNHLSTEAKQLFDFYIDTDANTNAK